MITKEAGAMSPKNDMLVVVFDLNIAEHDILKDIKRIILETEYHAKAEFNKAIPELCVANFFTYLVRLFSAQSAIAPRTDTKVRVKVPKNDLTKLSFVAEDFDERVVSSVSDSSALTPEERAKVDGIKMRYMPDLNAYTSLN